MKNEDKMREAFEVFISSQFPHLETYGVEGFGGKIYRSAEIANMDLAYKAGAAQERERIITEIEGSNIIRPVALAYHDACMQHDFKKGGSAEALYKSCAKLIQSAIIEKLKP